MCGGKQEVRIGESAELGVKSWSEEDEMQDEKVHLLKI